jgi:hypothetical protein
VNDLEIKIIKLGENKMLDKRLIEKHMEKKRAGKIRQLEFVGFEAPEYELDGRAFMYALVMPIDELGGKTIVCTEKTEQKLYLRAKIMFNMMGANFASISYETLPITQKAFRMLNKFGDFEGKLYNTLIANDKGVFDIA